MSCLKYLQDSEVLKHAIHHRFFWQRSQFADKIDEVLAERRAWQLENEASIFPMGRLSSLGGTGVDEWLGKGKGHCNIVQIEDILLCLTQPENFISNPTFLPSWNLYWDTRSSWASLPAGHRPPPGLSFSRGHPSCVVRLYAGAVPL